MCDLDFEAHVIWGSEIYISKKGFSTLVKYLNSDKERKIFTNEWWHSDDDCLEKANTPLKLTTLCCPELMKSGETINLILAKGENNLSGLHGITLLRACRVGLLSSLRMVLKGMNLIMIINLMMIKNLLMSMWLNSMPNEER